MKLLRLPLTLSGSGLLTLALFILMSSLVLDRDTVLPKPEPFQPIRFGPVELEEEIPERVRRKPPEPTPPKPVPRTPKLSVDKAVVTPSLNLDLNLPDLALARDGVPLIGSGGFGEAGGEGDIVPLVRISPIYPRDAALQGREGWVRLAFTITPMGTVTNPRVVEADPPRVFNRAALRAISRWKFKPRIEDGTAVAREATQVITFSLDQAAD